MFMMNQTPAQDNIKTKLAAHRGGSGYAPENTLAAIAGAAHNGWGRIELDVRLSSDGEVVVIHDETLNRTTNGKGRVEDFTLAELRKLDAGSAFGEKFAGEKIPLLREALEQSDGRSVLLIELKGNNPGLVEAVARLISGCNAESRCVVQSFNLDMLRQMHHLLPSLKLGWLRVKAPARKILNMPDEYGFLSEVNIQERFAGKSTMELLHKAGKNVWVWTVNKPEKALRILQRGADGIITDHPAAIESLSGGGELLPEKQGY